MNSLILRTATKLLLAVMLLFSIFILFRGHNEPGGGFIAGLITGSAFSLYLMAHGPVKARRLILVDLHHCLGFGIACSIVSGLIGVIMRKPFLTGVWLTLKAGRTQVSLGTPLLFDVGVYIVVVSAICMIVFALEEK